MNRGRRIYELAKQNASTSDNNETGQPFCHVTADINFTSNGNGQKTQSDHELVTSKDSRTHEEVDCNLEVENVFPMETGTDLIEFKRQTRKQIFSTNYVDDHSTNSIREPYSPDVSEYVPPVKSKRLVFKNSSSESEQEIQNIATVAEIPDDTAELILTENLEPENNTNTTKKKKRNMPKKSTPGRKRVRNVNNWKEKLNKTKKNRGEEFINKKGKLIEARNMKPPCKTSCRKKCQEKLSEEMRLEIFKSFWEMGDHNNQIQYLSRCVQRLERKYVMLQKLNTSRRHWTYCYSFMIHGEKIVICKTTFLNTLNISDKWLTTLFKKIDEKGNDCTSLQHQRGRNPRSHRNLISSQLKTYVREHISQIHFVESHYVRARSVRKYFEEHLTFPRLYKLYLEWFSEMGYNNDLRASERQYRDIFYQEYNIGFFHPKKDRCVACDIYNRASPDEKLAKGIDHSSHMASKFVSRQLKTEFKEISKSNSKILVASYDLQKILITPMSDVSPFYYKRKLAVYNLTIFDIGKNEGYCFMWNETVGKKGNNEISSGVYAFIERKSKEGVEEFIFFSDNCGGQNKNRIIFSMYAYAAKKFNVDITHIFFEVGHTQNEGDSMHSVIEQRKKNQVIYTPDQWVTLVRCAKIKGKPYDVTELSQNTIYDFKVLMNSLPNTHFDINRAKVRWNDVSHVKFSKEFPNKMRIGYALYTEEVTFIDFFKKETKRTRNNEQVIYNYPEELKRAYNGILPISAAKYKDLMSLCKTHAIPEAYHDYYSNLKYSTREEDDEEDSE